MNIPFFQVDAFAEQPLTGNPAAVMPLTRWLPDEILQAIAAENNLSETAFTVPSRNSDADYELRWFTPTVEVDLCGHGTIAAGHVLIEGERVRFATRSGTLSVSRRGDSLELELPSYDIHPGGIPGLLEALGAQGEVFVCSGAEPAVIILVTDEAAVRSVRPDFAKLASLHYLVIVTAPGTRHDVVSRVFCPFIGIDEDHVTGAAHAALTPFWTERLGRDHFTALQASQRLGVVHCRLEGSRVVLGGHCVTVIDGMFRTERVPSSAASTRPQQPADRPEDGVISLPAVINIADKLGQFSDHWNPRIVGQYNGNEVRVSKLLGEFIWHSHSDTDELFFVLKGKLRIAFNGGERIIGPGELIVVPKGVEHLPIADEECHLIVFDREGESNTGTAVSVHTRAVLEQI